jgi:hypothetical protein
MSNDWARVGPYNQRGSLVFPNYAGDLQESHAAPVDPFATFTVQLYWQVLGQARFPSGFDRRFVRQSRIYVEGVGATPDLDQSQLVRYHHPSNGKTYIAVRYGDSAGEAMLDRALTMTRWSNHCDDSSSTSTEDDDCDPNIDQASKDFVTTQLDQYVELLEVMADLTPMMDYGNPYAP